MDTNLDSNSDSDLDLDDDDYPTTPTAEEQPKIGHDLKSIKEKVEDDKEEEDNVITDDMIMQCPLCTANPIGTNVQNYDICRFAVRGPCREAAIEARKLITELNELLDLDIDDTMNDINKDSSLTPRKRKKQQPPEGFVKRVKEYYYWCNKIREKNELGQTPDLYKAELAFMSYLNTYYEYSTKFVLKVDSSSYVFSKDNPRFKTWNKRCDEMWTKLINHEGPSKKSIMNLIEFTTDSQEKMCVALVQKLVCSDKWFEVKDICTICTVLV